MIYFQYDINDKMMEDASSIMRFKSNGIQLKKPTTTFEVDVSNWPPEIVEAFIKELEALYADSITDDIDSGTGRAGVEPSTESGSAGGADDLGSAAHPPGGPGTH